ncbi:MULTISPECIES: hypothetical protein [unclassified Streptomyces]|uniref:hypothetical protein n=1 Tax=unclassified Streptomyces TaxID=2593676 RepID=UPI0036E8A8D2
MPIQVDDTMWREEDLSPFGEYDWPTWANGDTWMARRGEDFHCEPEVFVKYLTKSAEYEGRTREVLSRIIGDDIVCFRLLDPADDDDREIRSNSRAHARGAA